MLRVAVPGFALARGGEGAVVGGEAGDERSTDPPARRGALDLRGPGLIECVGAGAVDLETGLRRRGTGVRRHRAERQGRGQRAEHQHADGSHWSVLSHRVTGSGRRSVAGEDLCNERVERLLARPRTMGWPAMARTRSNAPEMNGPRSTGPWAEAMVVAPIASTWSTWRP